jgi:phage tail-like protein
MPASMRKNDPYLSLRFRVEINGIETGGFTEVSGLQVEVEVFDYREGGVNEFIHKIAGPVRYQQTVTLKHGLMEADQIWQWEQQMLDGDIQRHNMSIILMDEAGADKWRWDIKNAYPIRWSGPGLRANAAEVAIETLELAHQGIAENSGRR